MPSRRPTTAHLHPLVRTGRAAARQAGTISVVGPGTGLGVAQLRRSAGRPAYHVQPTEGGHIDYAPLDRIEDAILARLRGHCARSRRGGARSGGAGHRRHSRNARAASRAGRSVSLTDKELVGARHQRGRQPGCSRRSTGSASRSAAWQAISRWPTARARWSWLAGWACASRTTLIRSGFAERFCAKGRFEALMAAMPVKLITHPQPGLFGAAAAFAQAHAQ